MENAEYIFGTYFSSRLIASSPNLGCGILYLISSSSWWNRTLRKIASEIGEFTSALKMIKLPKMACRRHHNTIFPICGLRPQFWVFFGPLLLNFVFLVPPFLIVQIFGLLVIYSSIIWIHAEKADCVCSRTLGLRSRRRPSGEFIKSSVNSSFLINSMIRIFVECHEKVSASFVHFI